MLGICPACEKLTPIRQGSQEWVTRARDYFPIRHDTLPIHLGCGGVVELVEYDNDGPNRPMYEWQCTKCDCSIEDINVLPSHPCDGHKRAIR